MDVKDVKTVVTTLQKTSDAPTIISVLQKLQQNFVPTQATLRETKVGVYVNKLKNHPNKEIASLVTKIISSWKQIVTAEKKNSTASPPPPQPSDTKKFVAKGIRNPKNDGVKVDFYDNPTRNSSVGALYSALALDSTAFPNEIIPVAKEIETQVFKLEYFSVTDGYRNKLRSLIMNLRNKKNPELRLRLITRQVKPEKFVVMKPEDMAPESLKKEIEKIHEKNLFDAQGATEKRAVTDRFTCGKCKHTKVSYYQMQTRSADEPLTTFCTCENCNNRWKFS